METIALAAKEMIIYGAGSIVITSLVATLVLTVYQLVSRSIGDVQATVQTEGALQ
jgi:hypothetical protein